MEELRDLRRRIRSVRSTQHITRAMSLVASTRLRRVERLVEPAREYAAMLKGVVRDIAARTPEWAHPLLAPGEGTARGLLVITSDRGLAGAYNADVLREAMRFFGTADLARHDLVVVVAGRKGRDFLIKRGFHPVSEYVPLPEMPEESLSRRIALDLLTRYSEGAARSVHMVFARFVSRGSYLPCTERLLPISESRARRSEEAQGSDIDYKNDEDDRVEPGERTDLAMNEDGPGSSDLQYVYEPSPESVLDVLFPHYLASAVYAALVEAKASEFAARTVAMDSATDNAGELIEGLTLAYNRARQTEITQEISEIAAGAKSLR
ncbi:MAG: ATP synthase F1 subunit gamma [Firmicutes bacterium]|jgi:F-type H+-transporting ATPase subunit gamma|nr:ATP synthase F1 subunit gamma [Bacillota bacterium]MDH7495662.1 ATP synthase F1 subunit gamma [Bacillota bacterium]